MQKNKRSDHIFIERDHIQKIKNYCRDGMFRISENRYRYSTKNIHSDISNFRVEDIFQNLRGCERNLSADFIKWEKELITTQQKGQKLSTDQLEQFYYSYYNEFMTLNDFLEFYHKYLNKRKMDMEKLRYQIKFKNEVSNIMDIKTKRFVETETHKMGGKISDAHKDKLDKKIVKFQEGLDYAINKMTYQQAGAMLRKLTTVPQPPMRTVHVSYKKLNFYLGRAD